MPKLNIKIPHVVSVIGMAFIGAFVGYFSQKDPGTVLTALAHWNTAEPMLFGALAAALGTVYPLLQHSILAPNPPTGVSGTGIGSVTATMPVVVPPAPPERNVMTKTLRGTSFHMGRFLLAPIAFALVACTASELASLKSVADVAGNVCTEIVTAADPSLVALCTTPAVLDSAYVALLTAYQATQGDAGVDGGVGSTAFVPSQAALYSYVASHGGVPVGKAK